MTFERFAAMAEHGGELVAGAPEALHYHRSHQHWFNYLISQQWQSMVENLQLAHQEVSIIIDLINTVETNDVVIE
ncbi:mediator of RNA polymerase II transcription subunit 17 [Pyrus ussuriensis x Pyrus communis]|uniref:Mediator of RNA polymerase II transcription subunit 17 n=1 Tax=Pyrus ussuriensis x Pyrus communis TaxID=2448454 RepID=A0A5N5GNE3_9ROSA|nr:mediator of RNA polymerase II transcription subunit 17 [Pyrus ussuriensis x Pyrus communis]